MEMLDFEFILYVADQSRSRDFYATLLDRTPVLDVPGMTAFQLAAGVKLGLMPEAGIARIIVPAMQHPADGTGVPRCELYLRVQDLAVADARAVAAGARGVDAARDRDWGDRVSYWADADGHVIALAMRL